MVTHNKKWGRKKEHWTILLMHNYFYAPALQLLHVLSEQIIPVHHTETLEVTRL